MALAERNHNGLTLTQQRVADAFLSNPAGGKWQAFCSALGRDPTGEGSRSQCYDMFRDPGVEAYIDQEMQYLEELSQVSRERIMKELAAVAFFDPRSLFDDAGNFLTPKDWSEQTARAVSSIDHEVTIVRTRGGEEIETRGTKKLRTHAKLSALDQLSRILGLYKDSLEVRAGALNDVLERTNKEPLVPPGVNAGDGRSALETEQPLLDQGRGRGEDQI